MIPSHRPVTVGPLLAGIMLTMESPTTRLSLDMPLIEAEALLIELEVAVIKARAWRPNGRLSSVLG